MLYLSQGTGFNAQLAIWAALSYYLLTRFTAVGTCDFKFRFVIHVIGYT